MDWKHTFLFLVVAIPSVAILTRVIAWICRKKKSKAEPELELLEAPMAKPYATYEEYKKDLRGTVDLDVFLARCRAGVPENPEKGSEKANLEMASARERLARLQARLRGRLDKTPVSSLPNATVPVVSGGAGGGANGGAGGEGLNGFPITGIGSPPPVEFQPRLQDVAYHPKLQDLGNGKLQECPMCRRSVGWAYHACPICLFVISRPLR